MEDYVYTFLERAAAAGEDKEEKERRLAVFMGETKWDAGTGYLFIRGAVLVSGEEISQEHVELTDGSIGNASSYTPQAFWRRKSADADGSVGQRRSFFSL